MIAVLNFNQQDDSDRTFNSQNDRTFKGQNDRAFKVQSTRIALSKAKAIAVLKFDQQDDSVAEGIAKQTVLFLREIFVKSFSTLYFENFDNFAIPKNSNTIAVVKFNAIIS